LNFSVTKNKVAVMLEKTKRGVAEGVNSIGVAYLEHRQGISMSLVNQFSVSY
jgi:hypothetical protein